MESLRCSLVIVASVAALGCSKAAAPVCNTSDDCGDDEVCVAEACVAATTGDADVVDSSLPFDGGVDAGEVDAAVDSGGAVDCPVTVACLGDADGDRYGDGDTTVDLCHDPSRDEFGNCPAGYVGAAVSLGADCDDQDASLYQMLSVRVDADGDGYCTNASPVSMCSGAQPAAGFRVFSSCWHVVDCNDGDSSRTTLRDLRTDVDGDHACVGFVVATCMGTAVPAGKWFDDLCSAEDDCNDADAAIYRQMSLRTDADADTYCTAAAAVVTCIGAAVPSGKVAAATCNATADCLDTNAHAGAVCSTNVVSNTYDRLCDIGQPVSTNWSFWWTCPTGFLTSSASFGDNNSTDGDDAYYTNTSYDFGAATATGTFTCYAAAVGHDYYTVTATCTAF